MHLNFATTVFGNSYLTFLFALIGSIDKSVESFKLYVFYKDIDIKNIQGISDSRINFVDLNSINFKNTTTIHHLISSKIYLWREALSYLPEKETVLFIDVDTIINKNPTEKLNLDFNIIFTKKNEKRPINTGVLIVKNNGFVKDFFERWAQRTIQIIEDRNLLDIAISKNHPYGGADQMSFYGLVNFQTYNKPLTSEVLDQKILAFECNEFNQTNSVKVDSKTFIYHFKGGWHDVLLNGKSFNFKRTLKESKEMLIMFNNHLSYFSKEFNVSNNYTSLKLSYFNFKNDKTDFIQYCKKVIHFYFSIVLNRIKL